MLGAAAPSQDGKRFLLGGLSLLLAAAVWLPSVHLFFTPSAAPRASAGSGVSPHAGKLAHRQIALWTEPGKRSGEIARMRASNAEWDFMGRSFLVWSLANMALRDPGAKDRYIDVMDAIIDETLRIEQTEGLYHFLMPYARRREFILQPARSQFLDGEIALMLGLRRMLSEKQAYRALLGERVSAMTSRMRESPVLSAESYPDECWTFCNTVALAAIKVSDILDGTDHSDFFRSWVQMAKTKLTDPTTGLLVSSYTLNGRTLDGPEGSSIWMAAHALQVIDEEFARDQYARAKRELSRRVLGFGYATEWPRLGRGPQDVDSGPVIPGLDVSGGSSGLAFVAASAFEDDDTLASLTTTLDFAAFPSEKNGELRYCASNQVGDAVLLYSTVLGPAWQAVKDGKKP